MPEVDVPVIGNVDEKWVYGGAALVVGIAGYAWLSRGRLGTLDADDELIGPAGEVYDAFGNLIGQPGSTPGYVPPTVVDSNIDVDERKGPTSNAEWARLARDELAAYGADGPAVTAALGKFLDRRPLTPAEADLVRQAIAVAGQPPQGGPWDVIEPTTTPPGELPAPVVQVGDRSTTAATFSWSDVPGAARYIVGKEKGGSVVAEADVGLVRTYRWSGVSPAGSTVALRVWPVSDQNVRGDYGRASVNLPNPPSSGGGSSGGGGGKKGRKPSDPRGVLAGPAQRRGYFVVGWPAVPGATKYRYRWETARRRSRWAYTSRTRITHRWLWPGKGSIFLVRVQAGNKHGWSSPGKQSNHVKDPWKG